MKATIQRPEPVPPPPATVTLEMTEQEATLLRGFIGTTRKSDYEEAQRRSYGDFRSANLNEVDSMSMSLYSALSQALRS